jgi:hypothetical protein
MMQRDREVDFERQVGARAFKLNLVANVFLFGVCLVGLQSVEFDTWGSFWRTLTCTRAASTKKTIR